MHRRDDSQSLEDLGTALHLAVLRALPSPILVLSPSKRIVFANEATEMLFRGTIHDQSMHGLSPSELGLELPKHTCWENILQEAETAHIQSLGDRTSKENNSSQKIETILRNKKSKQDGCSYRICVIGLPVDDRMYYILSFETFSSRKLPAYAEIQDTFGKGWPLCENGERMERIASSTMRDTGRIRQSVFDSCKVPGFIISADGEFYLANKKSLEMLGKELLDVNDLEGPSCIGAIYDIWDADFTRILTRDEYPGIKLVRAQKPFDNYWCGFTNTTTGVQTVMNVSGELLYDEDSGEFLGGICWCHEFQPHADFVSNQVRQLLLSHETICNLMPHLVWTTAPDGTNDYFSDGWFKFTGMSKDGLAQDGWVDAVHPDDREPLRANWEAGKLDRTPCEVECRYRRYDGVYKWMLIRAVPLFDKDSGKLLKWYGTNTDIHDLVIRRIEAARKELQILTVLDHSEIILFSINRERKVTLHEGGMPNPRRETLIGADAFEMIKLFQPGGLPEIGSQIEDILEGRVQMASNETAVEHGGKIFRTRLVAELEHDIVDGGRKPKVIGVLGLTIDVTDMKARAQLELENSRLQMEEQAAQDSNRIKSEFLANMSHELRTPAAGVIGLIELLSDDPHLSLEQQEYINSISFSAKALLTIVNDILDFSKIESGRLDIEEVPFKLTETVGELCKLLGMFASQKGLEFIYENDSEDTLEVLGDPGRIRQVLSNLLTNALKFTTQGYVKLSVTFKHRIPVNVDHGTILEFTFVVEDTGIGIEKNALDKLFRPFRQGDASTARLYGGTGLGLTISKNLASLMGGSIVLDSTHSVGSRATFTVPLKVSTWSNISPFSQSSPNPGFRFHSSPPKPTGWDKPIIRRSLSNDFSTQDMLNQHISSVAAEHCTRRTFARADSFHDSFAARPKYLSPDERKKIQVLVVEDNAINQVIATRTILKLGFAVTAVWNGREALSYLLSPSPEKPRPDIILMDVQMPVLDGYTTTRILRTDKEYGVDKELQTSKNSAEGPEQQQLRDIPVIAMTASAIQGDREKCHEAGMDDYLSKPVEKLKLEEMLLKWTGRRRDSLVVRTKSPKVM